MGIEFITFHGQWKLRAVFCFFCIFIDQTESHREVNFETVILS